MIEQELQNEIFDSVKASGGGSFYFDGTPRVLNSGFSSSLSGFETILKLKGLTPVNLVNALNELARKVEDVVDHKTHMLGVWVDSDNLYIDLSVQYQDIQAALVSGRENEQIAIWDNAKGEEIRL